jgi:hypothetical protein
MVIKRRVRYLIFSLFGVNLTVGIPVFPEITTTYTNNKAVSQLLAVFIGDLEEIDHVSDQ